MGLQACRECGNQVSIHATSCPKCGAPKPAYSNWNGTGVNWKSKTTIFGIPLIHVAYGRDANGRLRIAKGIIAIGQFGIGGITIAQFGIGVIFGLGQFLLGLMSLGQIAIGGLVGIGQVSTGVIAIGQFVGGLYGLCQAGCARYIWSPDKVDMEAVALFHTIYSKLVQLIGL